LEAWRFFSAELKQFSAPPALNRAQPTTTERRKR
jgi:hypothetical protein